MVALARLSSSRPPALRPDDATTRPAKSGRILGFPTPDRPLTCEGAAIIAARLVSAAFPGPSENAVCIRAASILGVSENTVRRILRRETQEPSARIVLTCMSIMAATGRDPLAILGPHLPALQRALANPSRAGDGPASVTGGNSAPVSLPGRVFRGGDDRA